MPFKKAEEWFLQTKSWTIRLVIANTDLQAHLFQHSPIFLATNTHVRMRDVSRLLHTSIKAWVSEKMFNTSSPFELSVTWRLVFFFLFIQSVWMKWPKIKVSWNMHVKKRNVTIRGRHQNSSFQWNITKSTDFKPIRELSSWFPWSPKEN